MKNWSSKYIATLKYILRNLLNLQIPKRPFKYNNNRGNCENDKNNKSAQKYHFFGGRWSKEASPMQQKSQK